MTIYTYVFIQLDSSDESDKNLPALIAYAITPMRSKPAPVEEKDDKKCDDKKGDEKMEQ